MVDALVQFLLEEIAFDADAGTDLAALSSLISQYYSLQQQHQHSASPSSSTSPFPAATEDVRTQKIDDAFLSFVWSALVGQDDVWVGVMDEVKKDKGKGKEKEDEEEEGEEPKAEADEGEQGHDGETIEDGPGPSTSTAPTKKPAAPKPKPKPAGKGKKAAAPPPTHTMTPLPSSELDLPLDELRARYEAEGEGRLRVLVGEETAWAAITGSHAKISSLTPQIYSVLKMIARGRENGTTAVRISREMGIEPKSVFHCIKIPTGLGITKKIPDIDQGARTNRILHVRYLSRSPAWAVHIASEGASAEAEEGGNDGGEEEEAEEAYGEMTLMTPIGPQYLSMNRELVKQRVLKALRRRKGGWMFHHEIAPSIGLHSSTSQNLRRLNAIITDLAHTPGPPLPNSFPPNLPGPPLVEKVLVAKKAANPAAARASAGRLSRKLNEGLEGWGEVEDADEEEEEMGMGMEETGVTVKEKKGRKGVVQVQAHVLRLVKRAKEEEDGAEGDPTASTSLQQRAGAVPRTAQDDEEDDDPSLYPVAGKTIERQVLELLMNADKRGMTGSELSLSLGSFAPRFIDALLTRLSRSPPPAHLSDFALHSVTETVGRVKQTRWFSMAGYLGFRREMGVVDEEREEQWREKEEAAREKERDEELGGWSEVSPWEGQFVDEADAKKKRSKFNTMFLWVKAEGGGAGAGQSGAKARKERTSVGVKARKKKAAEGEGGEEVPAKAKGKGKGKEKAADQDAPLDVADDNNGAPAASSNDDGETGASGPPRRIPKSIGRPRKNPLPPGVTESPYMRRKREKAEDEERERMGLPPLERVKRGRKKRGEGVKKEDDGGQQPTPGPSSQPAGPTPDGTPVPQPKKRGRPPKKVTASAFAGVSPATSVPASAANLAQPTASTPAPASPSKSRIGAASSVAASTPSRPVKRRLEPYVEIVVDEGKKGSPASARKKKQKKGDDAQEDISTPAGKGQGKGAEEEVESGEHGEHGEELETVVRDEPEQPVPGLPSEAQRTPAATSTPQVAIGTLGSFETPQLLSRSGTPASTAVSSTKRARKKDRPRKMPKDKENLTFLIRQQEVVDYTASQGGIWAREPRSTEFIRDFIRASKGDMAATQMDRTTFQQVLDNAVKRDILRKTIGSDNIGRRREIFYFPSVPLDSQQAIEFLSSIKNGQGPNRYISVDTAQSIGMEADVDVGNGRRGKRGWFGVDGEDGAKGMMAPRPTADPETIRDFYRNEPGILGRSHGVKHGHLARARQLHKWLASLIFAQPDGSDIIVRRDERGLVISQATLLTLMPVGVFVRMIPLAVESPALDAFLAQPQNLQLPMSALPAEMHQLIKPRASKRKAALWKILDTLVKLHLLERLVPSTTETNGFDTPIRPREVTHWRFRTTVPVYAVRNDPISLIAVRALANNADVAGLWDNLQQASDVNSESNSEVTVSHPDFPDKLQTTAVFRKDLRSSHSWRDSYQLSTMQRSFLFSLLQDNLILVEHGEEEDFSAEIASWASLLYAPAETVSSYLHDVWARQQKHPRRKTRKRRKIINGEEVAGAEWEDGEEEEERMDMATVLQRKVKGAAEQRERDWVGIVERFRNEHGQPDLDAGIVDYLHRRFVDPRRQIDAVQLDFELRRLLPQSGEGAAAPAAAPQGHQQLKTVVPLALIRKARLAKDPYAISRQPNIRKRVRAQKTKDAKRAPAAPQQKQESKPFTTGDQSEFLAVPLPPRPELQEGKRLPRNFFSPEQDDLFLDAMAILKVRAKRLGMRIAWGALEQLFKGHLAKNLGVHSKKLIVKPEDAAYHDRLMEAWEAVYEERKDELDDPNPSSMTQFDIAACVRCLRTHIDKRILRLTLSKPQQLPDALALPATTAELAESYTLTLTDAAVRPGGEWDKVWRKHHVAANIRDEAVAGTPCAKAHYDVVVKSTSVGRGKELAAAALKTLLSTPDETYDEAQGVALLAPFEPYVDDVIKALEDKHIVIGAHTENGRRLPGRNYSYDDRYLDHFDNRVDLGRLASAKDFEREMHSDGFEGIFPLIPTEGEMMAFFDLVSEGKAELSIDTSSLTEKTLRFDDYLTRQANDDDIECGINIEPVEARVDHPLPLPVPTLPASMSDESEQVEQARQALRGNVDDAAAALAASMEAVLAGAGAEGVPYSDLVQFGPSSTVLSAIQVLVSPSSGKPLAFFAGTSAPCLVSSLYLSSWAINLLSSPDKPEEHQSKRILPCLWIDLHGKVNLELWSRAVGWVKGELLQRAGSTAAELIAKAVKRNLLSSYEVQRILTTLLSDGTICRRRAGVEDVLKADVLVDWERDGWFVVGTFW
ncbi:hypothetical protein JCM11251_007864 [Rhodosporidiobolus azoricus]